MSSSIGQQERSREPLPLQEILGSTSFVSASGRVYHLFGNEDKQFSLPAIPAIPPFSIITETSPLSLEEALQKIETYTLHENPPTIQLFIDPHTDIDKVGCVPRFHSPETLLSSVPIPAKDIIDEVSAIARKPSNENWKPLRVLMDHCDEPFIVPFVKPEPLSEEIKAEKITLKIAAELVLPVLVSQKTFRMHWQSRHKKQTFYRKTFSLPPVVMPHVTDRKIQPIVSEVKPVPDLSKFQWSALSDSLKQTASNQIRMLTDHLIVQSNQGIKGICFKGVFPEDGCSTILLCAVRALTERKHRVLLIDAHYRHIDLPKQLNLLGNLDSGNEVLTLNEYLGMWVWQESRTVKENTAMLTEVMAASREDYDLMLLDCGSLTESPLTEFVELWNQIEADGVILVPNVKQPKEISMSHIADRLRQHHIHLIGITENHVQIKRSR